MGFSSWLFSPPAENPTQLRESGGAGNPWTCFQGQIQNHSPQYVPLCPFACVCLWVRDVSEQPWHWGGHPWVLCFSLCGAGCRVPGVHSAGGVHGELLQGCPTHVCSTRGAWHGAKSVKAEAVLEGLSWAPVRVCGTSWGMTAAELPTCSLWHLQVWAVPCQGSEAETGQEQA